MIHTSWFSNRWHLMPHFHNRRVSCATWKMPPKISESRSSLFISQSVAPLQNFFGVLRELSFSCALFSVSEAQRTTNEYFYLRVKRGNVFSYFLFDLYRNVCASVHHIVFQFLLRHVDMFEKCRRLLRKHLSDIFLQLCEIALCRLIHINYLLFFYPLFQIRHPQVSLRAGRAKIERNKFRIAFVTHVGPTLRFRKFIRLHLLTMIATRHLHISNNHVATVSALL